MLKRNQQLILRDIGGEGILIPTGLRVLDLNGLVTLNGTARCIWELLDGRHSLEEIGTALQDQFEIGKDQALTDIQEFVTQLDGMGLLAHESASH